MVMKCVDELPANKEAIKCFHTSGGQVSITDYELRPRSPRRRQLTERQNGAYNKTY